MATTAYPVNHPAAVKHWATELFKEALKETYAARFMARGSGALAQVRSETKDHGDTIYTNLRVQLSGAGKIGDAVLEGNEEALQTYRDAILIDQMRHAVRSEGKMSEQRVPWQFRSEAKDALVDWFADRIDRSFFNQLCGNDAETDYNQTGMQVGIAPSSGNVILDQTATASLGTSNTFNIKFVDYAIELAKNATYPIRPIRTGGKEYYVMFLHDYQATDLRRSFSGGDWGDIQKAAIQGGQTTNNPIFSGALGVYNNTILHSSSRIYSPAANVHRAVFCGAQAATVAFGKGYSAGTQMNWHEEIFDYGNQLGVAGSLIWGLKKNRYNSVDHGTIVIPTYSAAHV